MWNRIRISRDAMKIYPGGKPKDTREAIRQELKKVTVFDRGCELIRKAEEAPKLQINEIKAEGQVKTAH